LEIGEIGRLGDERLKRFEIGRLKRIEGLRRLGD